MIYLRAHHILCILQFRGYGYSDEFIKNMQNIMNRLKIEPIIRFYLGYILWYIIMFLFY